MENQGVSITDVVFSVGFNSIPTFNRVFASLAGRSPTVFRQELREQAGPVISASNSTDPPP